MQNQTDEELVRVAQAGPDSLAGREAAACVLQRHARRIYVWCRRYSRDEEEARDLAQEVILRAYTRLSMFSHRSRFTSWLFTLTRHRCLSHVRRFTPDVVADLDIDTLPAEGNDPEDALLERLGAEALRRVIVRALEPEEQNVIWLRCVERMSVDSVTEVLGLQNASGARAVLQRARRKLRAALANDDSASRENDHG